MTHKNYGIQKQKQNTGVPPIGLMTFDTQQQLLNDLKVHQMLIETKDEELRRVQAELDATKIRFLDFYDHAPVSYLFISENGLIIDANLTACTMLGVTRDMLINQSITSFILPTDHYIYNLYHKHIIDKGDKQTCELQMLKKDGTTFFTRLETTTMQHVDGVIECCIMMDDITESKIKDDERELMESLIILVSEPGNLHKRMSDLIASLRRWSGCEAVGIRLHDKNDYPYFETHGFLSEFLMIENYLVVYGSDGKIICDDDGKPMLECMCGNILCGRFDPDKPFFTANGSFWSNNTSALLAGTTDCDQMEHMCNRCNAEGYESVALIPLRVDNQVFGLLQFNDHCPNRFSPDLIGYLEKMANSLAIILSRHQVDEALWESENRYRRIIDGITDYQYTVYVENNCAMHTIHNSACEKVTGYTYDEFTADPYLWIQMVEPKERDMVTSHVQQILKGINFPPIEHRIIRKDGETRWVRRSTILNKDIFGNLLSYDGVIQDITEQKLVESSLRESEANLKAIFASVPVGMLLLDEEKIIISSNDVILKLVSKEYGQIIQHRCGNGLGCLNSLKDERGCGYSPACADCHLRKGIEQVLQLNSSINGLEMQYTIFINGNNQSLWLNVSAEPVLINNRKHVVVAIHNITQRKQAEEELLESRYRLQTLTGNLPNTVLYQLVLDTKGFRQFTYINDAVCRINEVTVEEVMADSNVLYSQVLPEYLPGLLAAENKASLENTTFHYEFQCLLPSGKTPWFELTTSIRTLPNGYAISEGVQMDITERKQAEAEKAKLEDQLQQAQKMESVGRLAGGVAHDFNNMLQVILGNAYLAMLEVPEDSSVWKYLTEIDESAHRSTVLTRQLLAFARKQTIMPVVADLNEIVAGILKMLKRLIGEDINLKWIPRTDVYSIKVDPSQIDQILANLCVNARDAITDIGEITIETGNRIFDKDYCADHAGYIPGEYVSLSVSDNGCGMDKETQEHIFEPFFTTKAVGEGTGLGLSSVYGAVKQNDGYINVYSEKDMGTTFTIYLPRHAGRKIETQMEGIDNINLRGQETVLVVEDESSMLALVTKMFESQGYNTLSANTPGEAIRMAEEYTGEIDMLMTDVVMPNMNGNNLSKHLLMSHPNLKCLFMSGYTADVIANHGVLDQGMYFIQKPFSMFDLTTKVREVLK